MRILKNMAVNNWLPWERQTWWSRDTSVNIFLNEFQEKSSRSVVIALIVLKLYIFKVGAGVKSTLPRSELVVFTVTQRKNKIKTIELKQSRIRGIIGD